MAALASALEVLVRRLAGLRGGRSAPVLMALDGRSGSGKSTLAGILADATGAAVITAMTSMPVGRQSRGTL